MRSFEQRFTRPQPAELIERLRELTPGSVVSVRSAVSGRPLEFRKIATNSWANDFRAQIRDEDVASLRPSILDIVPSVAPSATD